MGMLLRRHTVANKNMTTSAAQKKAEKKQEKQSVEAEKSPRGRKRKSE